MPNEGGSMTYANDERNDMNRGKLLAFCSGTKAGLETSSKSWLAYLLPQLLIVID